MNNQHEINKHLKNVFDEKSVAAIRNVNNITPSPEVIHQKKMPLEEKREQQEESDDQQKIVQDSAELKALRTYIDEQEKRISVLIDSQNQLIAEFNKLEAQVKELAKKPIVQVANIDSHKNNSEEKLTVSKEKQQTGAGEGLNKEEYSVEKFFYFGRK